MKVLIHFFVEFESERVYYNAGTYSETYIQDVINLKMLLPTPCKNHAVCKSLTMPSTFSGEIWKVIFFLMQAFLSYRSDPIELADNPRYHLHSDSLTLLIEIRLKKHFDLQLVFKIRKITLQFKLVSDLTYLLP